MRRDHGSRSITRPMTQPLNKQTFTGGLHRASELDSVGAPSVPWAALHPKLPHAPIPSVSLPHVLKSDYRAEVVATGPVFKISPLGLLRITPKLQMPRNLSISQADKLQPGRCPSALPSAPAQDTLHPPGSILLIYLSSFKMFLSLHSSSHTSVQRVDDCSHVEGQSLPDS